MTERRLDRNGIPILDPPNQRNQIKRCHPALHVWREDRTRNEKYYSDYDWVHDILDETTEKPLVCIKCGQEDTDVIHTSSYTYSKNIRGQDSQESDPYYSKQE